MILSMCRVPLIYHEYIIRCKSFCIQYDSASSKKRRRFGFLLARKFILWVGKGYLFFLSRYFVQQSSYRSYRPSPFLFLKLHRARGKAEAQHVPPLHYDSSSCCSKIQLWLFMLLYFFSWLSPLANRKRLHFLSEIGFCKKQQHQKPWIHSIE